MNQNKIIKLKLDVIFKAMFGTQENEEVLANFLSKLLEIPRESIKKIIMDNVELIPENFADKFSRVDLKMQVDDKIVNVELQVNNEPDFTERTLYYWSKIFSGELKSGEPYRKLRETICINIVNFNIFDCPEYHSHFKIIEKTRHEVLTNKFGIHFFELKKIGKNPDKDNPMQLWLQLVNAETEEELDMLENTNVQEINQAIVVLRKLNADEKMRYISDMREMALHNEASAILGSKEDGIEIGKERGRLEGLAKGRAEGLAKGLAEGLAKGREEIIAKMRKKGMSDEMIEEILNS